MDSKRNLYTVLNKDKEKIWVIADSPTQAIDIACLPRSEQEAHIKANEAVAVYVDDILNREDVHISSQVRALLETGEIGEVVFNPIKSTWSWVAPFYVLEFKYHGPFNSNVAAANFAVNSGLPETARVLRMDR